MMTGARPQLRPSRLVTSAGILLSAAILAGAVAFVSVQRAETLERAEVDLARTNFLAAEAIGHAARTVDVLLKQAAVVLERMPAAEWDDEVAIRAFLLNLIGDVPHVRGMYLIDRSGTVIATTLYWPSPRASVSHRSYFEAHRDAADRGLFLAEPVKSLGTDVWSLNLARRLSGSDGTFRGVISVSVAPAYFERLFEALNLPGDSVASLWRSDGILLAQAPHNEAAIGRPICTAPPLGVGGSRSGGTETEDWVCPDDGLARLQDLRPVAGFPMRTGMALSQQGVLEPWTEDSTVILGGAVTVTLGLLAAMLRLSGSVAVGERDREALARDVSRSREIELTQNRRIREARLLFDVARLCGETDRPAEEIPKVLVVLMPLAWPDPAAIATRVTIGTAEAASANFHISARSIREPIIVDGLLAGTIAVVSVDSAAAQPFDEAAQRLVRAVAVQVEAGLARRQAERALREREAIFAAIVGQALDSIGLIDVETRRFVEFNQAAHDNLGYTREEFSHLGIHDIEASERVEDTEQHFARILANGGETFETRHCRKDGAIRDVRVGTRVIDAGGRPCVAAIWSDITERKATEQRLRASEAALNEAQSVAGVGSWRLDLADGRVTWSPQTYRMFGIAEGTPLSFRYILDLIHPADRNRLLAAWDTARESGAYDLEFRILIGTEIRWVRERAQFRHGADGRPMVAVGTVQDVTARKAAEEQIRELAERMALATSAAGVGIWDWDVGNNRLVWNDQMFRLYGIDPENFTGLVDAWRERVHPEDLARAEREIFSGQQDTHTVFRIVRPDGSVRTIEARARLRCDSEGRPVRILGTNWDITTHRDALEEIRLAKEQAESANIAKSRFLAMMSHELRTPLNAILGFAELLLLGEPEPNRKEQLGIIHQAGQNLLALIQDLLDLSRIEAGKVTIVPAVFDPAAEIESVVRLFRNEAARKGLVLVAQTAAAVPRRLYGDARLLRQTLINLIGNALKFTEHGRVDVAADLEAGPEKGVVMLGVHVTDTGIGIHPDNLPRMFGMFEQEDNSLNRRFGGSGLGLAISRRIVAMLGGRIWVESAPGIGSRFSFTALFDSAVDTPARIAPERAAGVAEPSGKILVVEDDLFSRTLLVRLLEEAGHSVAMAEDGAQALACLAEYRFDLVLMDVQLPVMDGVEAVRRIRAGAVPNCPTTLPVVAVTAYAMREDRDRFLALGMTDYLSKPIEADRVLGLIHRLLNPPSPPLLIAPA